MYIPNPWPVLVAAVACMALWCSSCTGLVHGRAGVRSDGGWVFAELVMQPEDEPAIEFTMLRWLWTRDEVYPGVSYRGYIEGAGAVFMAGLRRAPSGNPELVIGYESLEGSGVRLVDDFNGNSHAEAYVALRW